MDGAEALLALNQPSLPVHVQASPLPPLPRTPSSSSRNQGGQPQSAEGSHYEEADFYAARRLLSLSPPSSSLLRTLPDTTIVAVWWDQLDHVTIHRLSEKHRPQALVDMANKDRNEEMTSTTGRLLTLEDVNERVHTANQHLMASHIGSIQPSSSQASSRVSVTSLLATGSPK
ncbi:hypothetical protein LTR56_018274 [Elasticomyces elasticus]|nr:hypothetical protein LTR56_018274 [Elasticomyces elasticus]KAK3636764.1 hypothetical protein LTR22_018579 [Elasticomyces elasticus]KAK5751833.1 hypothetical protein LTS12_018074 [Elasticomyces elasticus]